MAELTPEEEQQITTLEPLDLKPRVSEIIPLADIPQGAGSKLDSDTVRGKIPLFTSPTGSIVQSVIANLPSFLSTSAGTPAQDDSKPQSSEGAEIGTVTITPKSITNILQVTAVAQIAASASLVGVIWVVKDSDVDSLGTAFCQAGTHTGVGGSCVVLFEEVAGSLVATTYKLRYGGVGGTVFINGQNSRLYGGSSSTFIKVTEISA